jgi:hypothetical protein
MPAARQAAQRPFSALELLSEIDELEEFPACVRTQQFARVMGLFVKPSLNGALKPAYRSAWRNPVCPVRWSRGYGSNLVKARAIRTAGRHAIG